MRTGEGFRSEALRDALEAALAGRPRELVELLARHGGLPGRPNLKLASAFGSEIAGRSGSVAPLLDGLADDDAAAEQARAFLPIAAAHGYAARLREGREVEPGWRALHELAADVRSPVRVGTLQALIDFAVREGAADALLARATAWLDDDERERMFSSAALAIEALSDARVLGVVRDQDALLEYLGVVIERIADAPRAAARSDGRRRALTSLPRALSAVVAQLRADARGFEWFRAQCERADHPDLRSALSRALIELGNSGHSPGTAVVDELRKSLEASAKPIRDAARVRPGHGRGRRSRPTR